MEFDQETHDKILTMAEDIKFIRGQLDGGKETFIKHDERIRNLEANQQLLTGKVTLLIMGIGTVVLFMANFIRELISR